jgi:hypothetical protein
MKHAEVSYWNKTACGAGIILANGGSVEDYALYWPSASDPDRAGDLKDNVTDVVLVD